MTEQNNRESQRLAALARYDILDTPREQAFDEIAELTAAVCDAPIAVVNLIADTRQFFKAEVGLGVRETPLDSSFCAHAILEDDFLIIPDATQDPRFACNPLVTDAPHIRFYAGALLKTSDGVPIGTLCVLDYRPRDLTDVQRQTIRVLARQVMAQIEQRRSLLLASVSEARQRAIIDSAKDFAIIATDLDGTIVEWSDGAEEILGWSEVQATGRNASLFFTDEDVAAGVHLKEMRCAADEGRANDERWHIRKDGAHFWASGEMTPLNDPSGRHIGYVKVLRDRTPQHLARIELEDAQQRLDWAQEAGGIGVFHVDPDGMLHATTQFCRLYGVEDCAAIPARVFEDLVVSEDRHLVSDAMSRADGSAPLDVEYRIRRPDTGEVRWIARKGEVQRDGSGVATGFAGVARDVTERRTAGDALARSDERFQTIMETIEAAFAIVEVKFDENDSPINYRFLEANPAFERQAGVDLRGKWVTEFAPDLEQFWFETYGHVAKTGEPTNFESYAEAFKRWFDVRAVRVGNPDDRQIAIFFNDVTERRGAQERLRASEALARENIERVQLALEAGAIIGTWHWDIPSDRFTIDDAFARSFGLDPALGRDGIPLAQIVATVHPDDQAGLAEAIDAVIAKGGAYAHQYRVRHADGDYRWIEANGRVEKAADGTATSFPGVLIDVDDRRAIAAERDRATAELRVNEAKWRGLFETLEEGFILGEVVRDASGRIVDWRYDEVNNAWYDLVGMKRGCAVGRTIRELFPEIEDAWVMEFARVVETGEAIRFTRQVGDLQRWYDGVCQPAGGDRFTVIFLEVTDRIQAEQRREAFAELSHALADTIDIDATVRNATAIVGNALGAGRVGYGTVAIDGETFTVTEDWTAEGYPSLAGTYRIDDYGSHAADLRAGRPVVVPDIRLDDRTAPRTAVLEEIAVRTMVNLPVVEHGRMVAIFFVHDDEPREWAAEEIAFVSDAATRIRAAIERRRAEEDLRESESFMRSVLSASTDCIKVLNLDGELTFMSEGGMKVMEISDFNAVRGCPWPDFLKDTGVGLAREGLEAAKAGKTFHFEAAADTYLGTPKFWSVSVSPIFGENGRVERILSVSRDHTTLEEAREQQRLLNGELSHRLKNVLTIVQSIANQTLRDAVTLEEASAAFSSRLASLGRATDVLTATSWEASDLTAVLEAGLAVVDGRRDRVSIGGPAIRLNSQSALALTLAIHELGTNALKYGALSNDTGTVALTWQVAGSETDPKFSLLWQERGGPSVSTPTRRGFGTRMIERSLRSYFRGETALSYPAEGVEFRINAPLSGAGELVTA